VAGNTYFMFKRYRIYGGILLVCLAIGIRNSLIVPEGAPVLVLDITSSEMGLTEIFYDLGTGFTAAQRIPTFVTVADRPMRLEFPLPNEEIKGLRWDPVAHESGVQTEVRSIRIGYMGGKHEIPIPMETVLPQNQIKTFTLEESKFRFEVAPEHDDPYLVFNRVPAAPEPPARGPAVLRGALFSVVMAALLAVLYRLIVRYFNA
jgi:hypothetical protein